MGVQFTGIVRDNRWAAWKVLHGIKGGRVQYDIDGPMLRVWFRDSDETHLCELWIGSVPDGVVQGGYDQAQNDADKADFETNYAAHANRSIRSAPLQLFATSVKHANSANLAVNGSLTPVVFEMTPPPDHDIHITHLSFLFEGTTMAFGDRFILNTLAALTNGLLLEIKTLDLTTTWQTMKRTRDLIEISETFSLITGTPNFLRVHVHLPQELRLARDGTYAQPDFLRLTVRDNLTSFAFAEAYVQGVLL